jgi:hypothetical protein
MYRATGNGKKFALINFQIESKEEKKPELAVKCVEQFRAMGRT